MKNALISILLLSSTMGCFSCIAKNNLDIQVPQQQKQVVVECYLTPGYPAELTLAESNTLDDELVLLALWNAQAYIVTDTGTLQLQNILYQKLDRQILVNYSNKDTIKSGHSFFNMVITTKKGVRLQASTGIVSQVHIKKVTFNENSITADHDITNVAGAYFKLVATTYEQGKEDATRFELYDQNNCAPGSCTLSWKNFRGTADSMVITLYHIQKDYYDYMRSVRNANGAYKDPFLNPEAIRSNIKGGIGLFTYYTFDKRSITF
jgi:hypothetical protein